MMRARSSRDCCCRRTPCRRTGLPGSMLSPTTCTPMLRHAVESSNEVRSRKPRIDPVERRQRVVIGYGQRFDAAVRGVQEQVIGFH